MVGLTEDVPLAWYQSCDIGFNSPRHIIFRCTYSTLTDVWWTHRHDRAWVGADGDNNSDLHTRGKILDYSIRDSLTPLISHEFYVWTDRWEPSSKIVPIPDPARSGIHTGTQIATISTEMYCTSISEYCIVVFLLLFKIKTHCQLQSNIELTQ
jgi:hypothetical protein